MKKVEDRNKVFLTTDIDFSKLYIEKTENFGKALIELCTRFISLGIFSERHILEMKNIVNQINTMLNI